VSAPAEQAIVFPCEGASLPGIVHPAAGDRGLLVVVGGPQYRIGSHRHFLLLARELAQAGVPVMRFDYRGMGDAEGEMRGFQAVAADIRAAVDAFLAAQPQLREVVLLGLCDAASAIACYAPQDPRVGGLVLLNPWVQTEAGRAGAYLRHYYLRRLLAADFWRGLFAGRVRPLRALGGLLGMWRQANTTPAAEEGDFLARMLAGLRAYRGPILLVLSGEDLVAAEFRDLLRVQPAWRKRFAAPGVQRHELEAADHTFSRGQWRAQVNQWLLDWLRP